MLLMDSIVRFVVSESSAHWSQKIILSNLKHYYTLVSHDLIKKIEMYSNNFQPLLNVKFL